MATRPNEVRQIGGPADLDAIDRTLVLALQRNARASNKELAELVGLAPSSCLQRLRRLRDRGIFRGFHADVDPAQLGRSFQAIIAVRLAVHSRDVIDDFYEHILKLPEALAVFHVGGADDYLIHVAVPDPGHLRELVLELTARSEVEHLETRLIFEYIRKPAIEPLSE